MKIKKSVSFDEKHLSLIECEPGKSFSEKLRLLLGRLLKTASSEKSFDLHDRPGYTELSRWQHYDPDAVKMIAEAPKWFGCELLVRPRSDELEENDFDLSAVEWAIHTLNELESDVEAIKKKLRLAPYNED